jgi:sec-independent protein translocase protein TatA
MTTGLLTPTHVAILLIVVLLILGPKRLPQAGRAIGQSLREFKRGITAVPQPDGAHRTIRSRAIA